MDRHLFDIMLISVVLGLASPCFIFFIAFTAFNGSLCSVLMDLEGVFYAFTAKGTSFKSMFIFGAKVFFKIYAFTWTFLVGGKRTAPMCTVVVVAWESESVKRFDPAFYLLIHRLFLLLDIIIDFFLVVI
jgi:hypothetical protein